MASELLNSELKVHINGGGNGSEGDHKLTKLEFAKIKQAYIELLKLFIIESEDFQWVQAAIAKHLDISVETVELHIPSPDDQQAQGMFLVSELITALRNKGEDKAVILSKLSAIHDDDHHQYISALVREIEIARHCGREKIELPVKNWEVIASVL